MCIPCFFHLLYYYHILLCPRILIEDIKSLFLISSVNNLVSSLGICQIVSTGRTPRWKGFDLLRTFDNRSPDFPGIIPNCPLTTSIWLCQMATPLPILAIGIHFHNCCFNDSQNGSDLVRTLSELLSPWQQLTALNIFDMATIMAVVIMKITESLPFRKIHLF